MLSGLLAASILWIGCAQSAEEEYEAAAVTAEERPHSLVWNAWFEGFSPVVAFKPVAHLKPNTTYLLAVDLAAVDYASEPDIRSREASRELAEWLVEQPHRYAELDVLVLPDPKHFVPPSQDERVRSLTVDLEKLRAVEERGLVLGGPPFEQLRVESDPLFSYGRVVFRLRTRSATGRAAIGLSFWVDRRLPVDEFSVDVCVTRGDEPCPEQWAPPQTLRGIDAVRVATQPDAPYPDAALQFVSLQSQNLIGVFRCNTCEDWSESDFLTWELNRTVESLARFLTQTILNGFEKAARADDPDTFRQLGRDFYYTLFGHHGSGEPDAETEFQRFVARTVEEERDEPRSIFVRLPSRELGRAYMVPLGLIAVPIAGEASVFLGLEFRVETPLWVQDYRSTPACLTDWTVLVPPETVPDPALQDARRELEGLIRSFRHWQEEAVVYEDLSEFRLWLDPVGLDVASDGSDVIMILSHHDDNQLFFDPQLRSPLITSAAIQREFKAPSVAIINACGAARPGADEWVAAFNLRGVSTVIATSSTVDARMAGRFMAILAKQLRENQADPNYTLGRATYETVVKLSRERSLGGELYGPRALMYQLMGNSSLQLCSPPEEVVPG